jgi:hypothetical protein
MPFLKASSSATASVGGLAERLRGLRALFARKGAEANGHRPSRDGTMTGANAYEALRLEQLCIAHALQDHAGAFGARMQALVEIDRRIDALVSELMACEENEHWQGNAAVRVAFARRLADTSLKLAEAYRGLLDEGRKKYPGGSRGASRLPALACRAVVHIGLAMKWCAYAKLPEPPSLWGKLYRLYRFAEKRRLLHDAVVLTSNERRATVRAARTWGEGRNARRGTSDAVADVGTTTCHREIARVMLFGLADARNFSLPMIDAAYVWCGEWADQLEFQRPGDATGERHCFDMDASFPPCQFHPQMRAERIRCFSTAAVCFKLVSLRDQTKYAQNSEAVHRVAAKLSAWTRDDLIRLLLNSWVKALPARRSERERDGIKVARLSCGVDAISELLHAESWPDEGNPPELAFEHWAVENESKRGYGLAKTRVPTEPEAGALVCVRANGSAIWQLGVVRWERDSEKGTPRMGIETLADNPQAVKLTRTGAQLADSEASINALLLPKQGVYDEQRSLVIPMGDVHVGDVYHLSSDKPGISHEFVVRITGAVDETDSWSRMTFTVLQRVA